MCHCRWPYSTKYSYLDHLCEFLVFFNTKCFGSICSIFSTQLFVSLILARSSLVLNQTERKQYEKVLDVSVQSIDVFEKILRYIETNASAWRYRASSSPAAFKAVRDASMSLSAAASSSSSFFLASAAFSASAVALLRESSISFNSCLTSSSALSPFLLCYGFTKVRENNTWNTSPGTRSWTK